jgi:hypothetical protein
VTCSDTIFAINAVHGSPFMRVTNDVRAGRPEDHQTTVSRAAIVPLARRTYAQKVPLAERRLACCIDQAAVDGSTERMSAVIYWARSAIDKSPAAVAKKRLLEGWGRAPGNSLGLASTQGWRVPQVEFRFLQ